ncbi:hypothetical protein G6O69_03615 [Pseudenhygromyxa sp. WMMC2535]|uniref:hypothetical protein n=1 Tax=Pseudenhygromyxa sp. WMMC2535 TaxID=2712867 RepID=UPI0015534845|nr:hypothetical protein [Pseudenhygromyxa sp. WMMC2535]NVB36903.1 hypothetical protein [Pseudenhygromyxa sp. WMMC2535]
MITSSLACSDDQGGGDDEVGEGSETEAGAAEAEDSSEGESLCEPGAEQACSCDAGTGGTQVCAEDGESWGECVCEASCGDMICDEALGESCESCEADCGLCLDCEEAPSCEGAAIPGAIETHLEVLDVLPEGEDEEMGFAPASLEDLGARVARGDLGVRTVAAALSPQVEIGEHPFVTALRGVFAEYPEQAQIVARQLARAGLEDASDYRRRFPDPKAPVPFAAGQDFGPRPAAGPESCEDPKLRVRLAKIIVHNEADLINKDEIYCAVISEAASGSEIRVTPRTFALDNDEEYTYALAEGVVWGQAGEPVAPKGNLSLTYNCLESDGVTAFEEFLGAIADAAEEAGGTAWTYGWVFGVVGLAADIIGAALSLEKDDHLFNASQIVPAALQLEMTQGVWWSVQRSGTFNLKNWHWELRMEAWGCTDDGGLR